MTIEKANFWDAVRFAADCADSWDLNEKFISDLQRTIAAELFESKNDWPSVEVKFTEERYHGKDFIATCGRERVRVEYGFVITNEEVK